MALSDHPMWRKPQHHLDAEHAHDHVHWVELFYDLVHVVTIFMLGNYLSHHLTPDGFLVFAGLFIAVWFAWADSSAFNSLYLSTDMYHRMIMSTQICTVMFMAAAIPDIPGKGWVYFALAYAANRAITAFMYWRARRHNESTSSLSFEMARNFFILAVIFAISAFIPKPYGYYLFGAGVVFIQALYMLPRIGVLRFERFVPRLGHMAERFALLLLIVLGEGFFKLVVTLADKGVFKVGWQVMTNVVIGGVSIFVLCWIYFDVAGNAKVKDTRFRTMVTSWLAHLFLMLCAVMIGVAMAGEVKVGFFEPFPTKYAWIGCFGLAGYILCLQIIQNTAEERVSHQFFGWPLRIFGICMALITLVVVPHVDSIVGNLMWGTALFSQIVPPMIAGYRKFSRE